MKVMRKIKLLINKSGFLFFYVDINRLDEEKLLLIRENT